MDAAAVKRILGVFLGILTAIGGFVDMGDLVANAATGARFDMNLAWVVLVGVVGIVVYAEMSGRVAAICGRPVFDLVRERLGPRFGLANLVASFAINLLTLTAEIAGVAIAISLVVERQLPAARPVRRRARVARRVAPAVRDDGARLRAARPVPARVRRRRCGRSGPTGASCGRTPRRPARAGRRDAVHVRLLRHRPVRRGDDPVRGVLLLQRRRRGRLDASRPQREPGQRVHRLPARRAAVAGDHGLRPPRARPRATSASTSCRRSPCPSPSIARQARPGRRPASASSRPRSAPPSRRRCRPATPSPSTSAGRGASTCRPRQASRFHVVVPHRDRRRRRRSPAAASTRSRSPSTRSCCRPPRCR